jgi:hypothetical protein
MYSRYCKIWIRDNEGILMMLKKVISRKMEQKKNFRESNLWPHVSLIATLTLDVADLFVALTISSQQVAESIMVSASREFILDGDLIISSLIRSTQAMYQILLFWLRAAHISCVTAPSMSIDMLDKWNINNQCPILCVRSGHVMILLMIGISFLVCPGQSINIHGTRTVLFVVCNQFSDG